MYPQNFPETNTNRAEQKVFNALRQLPEDEFDVFHSKIFRGNSRSEKADYEIDFIIVDKQNNTFNGILILEVKRGLLRYDASKNCWFQNNRAMGEGPCVQANSNKHSFIKRFENLLKDVPTEWLLWFPDCENGSDNFMPTEINKWQLLDSNDLAVAIGAVTYASNKIKEVYNKQGVPIEEYNNKLKKALLRDLNMIQPLNILLKKFDEDYIFLEETQKHILESIYNQPRLAVKGKAGSGKSLLGVSAATDFANAGKEVLMLCYNRLLAKTFTEACPHKNITVSTFHSFASVFIREIEPEWLDKQDATHPQFYQEFFPQKFGELLKQYPDKYKFDAIIIDEAQDFSDSWVDIILNLTKPEGNVIMLYDENQDLFKRDFHVPANSNFNEIELKYNFRNTQKICQYIAKETGLEVPSYGTPLGLDVKEVKYRSLDSLVSFLNIHISLLKNEKVKVSDMSIIIDGHQDEHPLKHIDLISGTKLQAWDPAKTRQDDCIYYTSVNRFKGLESKVAIVVLDSAKDAVDKQKFYTLCTRAKSHLIVFYKENE